MNKKEYEKKLEEKNRKEQLESMDANATRAQAISIGSSGSGTTEITMRGRNGVFLWNVFQPVQVIELIHQMSASIGCHIHIQPREDFASWRDWPKLGEADKLHLNGHPPFASYLPTAPDTGQMKKEPVGIDPRLTEEKSCGS
jgi:hypothetical protein|tara:strand:+ start:121 stop:546 length:426 start_codon:yes stop_codon:yes gene_type:complete